MDTAEKIAGLAAWRLGLALLAYQTQSENSSLADAKKIWNIRRRDINSLKDVDAINLISSVIAVLRSRGNSEEKFIGTLR